MKITPFGSATEEEICSFESRFNLKLPNDYRDLLKRWNGGFVKTGYFTIPGVESYHSFSVLYGLGVETVLDITYFKRNEFWTCLMTWCKLLEATSLVYI